MSDNNETKEQLDLRGEAQEVQNDQNDDERNLRDKLSNNDIEGGISNNEQIENDADINKDSKNEFDCTENVENNREQKDEEGIEENKVIDGDIESPQITSEKANEEKNDEKGNDEVVDETVEEEQIMEEPPPDPAAPLNLSDSKELMKPPFELRPDRLAEVEQLWDLFQNYTPVYTDIKDYITEKELVYLLKALLLMTYTPEQLQELIRYCVRPLDPNGHINYEQFLKMVTIRQRDLPVEEELRAALQVFDPDKTGKIDREYLKDVLRNLGNKLPEKQLDNLIKEVDMSNDGQIGIDDVVGTMGIDLNQEDILMLKASLEPHEEKTTEEF